MALDQIKNFAKVSVRRLYAAGETSIVLKAGDGSKLPDPSSGEFNLVWWNVTDYSDPSDDPNVEIIRVTAKSTDTLTITRAQESTSDVNHNLGSRAYQMILGPTKKTIDDIKQYVDDEIDADILTHKGDAEAHHVKYTDAEADARVDLKIEDGTAQGQLGFWDSTLGKWVHSETSELFWDDVNKRLGLGIATPLAQVHLLTDDGIIKFGTGVFTSKTEFTDTGIELGGSGRLRSGLFTEVNGSVLSYGINNPQIGGRDTSESGGIFRLDARGGREQFIVIGYKPGSDSDFERFAVSLSKGGIDIYHGDTSVAPVIRMRADNNHAYGFDFDIAKETIGRFDFYRVVNSVRTLVYSVLRSNGNFGMNTLTPQAGFHNVGDTRLGDQATNYASFAADGEASLHGTARVTRHIRVGAGSLKLGASSPTAGNTGVFPHLSFSHTVNQEAHFQLIVPHRWDNTTDMEICFDWIYTGAQDNGTVKWGLEYNSKTEGDDPTAGSVTISNASPGNHTTGQIVRTCLTTKILSSNLANHDLFGMRLFRDQANDTLGTGAILLGIHVHYIQNKLGEAT